MIVLSNGFTFEYMVASGALAFDGRGWFWEWPLRWCGLIRPELFAVVTKTVTLQPRRGNLRWWKPWGSVRLIPGGAVNRVGLTNPGLDWWCRRVGPKADRRRIPLMVSVHAQTTADIAVVAGRLNRFEIVGLEVNLSCPNSGSDFNAAQAVELVAAAAAYSDHPVIAKLSVAQDYLEIAKRLRGIAQAVSLNSVPWEMAFPGGASPFSLSGRRVGAGGGGGVSGRPAQRHNWQAVRLLVREVPDLPVIAPGIMEFEDVAQVRRFGADAVSFGAVHLRTPWKPTAIVRRQLCR